MVPSMVIFACLFDLHFRTSIKIYDINVLQGKSIVVGLFEDLGKEPHDPYPCDAGHIFQNSYCVKNDTAETRGKHAR